MTGWMEVEDAPQSSHNSIISTFTNISQGLGWCEERAINYLSASLAAAWPAWPHRGPGDPLFSSGSEECLLEAWTLASLGCKVSYPFRSLVMLPSTQGGWREIKHYGMH